MPEIKYKCLVLDHDDTTVKSTPDIHYPQWLETLDVFRPGIKMSLEEFMKYAFDYGFYPFIDKVMHFTDEEKKKQDAMWREYTRTHAAHFYEGIPEIIEDFRQSGGIVCVCTHNTADNILKDYNAHFGGKFVPDMIFDHDMAPDKMKPNPFALQEIMRIYSLSSLDILMVDDMKAGYDMAKKVGVPFAAAGWSHIVPQIREFMRGNCDVYLENVGMLKDMLFKV